jgi:hypothetical protein
MAWLASFIRYRVLFLEIGTLHKIFGPLHTVVSSGKGQQWPLKFIENPSTLGNISTSNPSILQM